MQKYQKSQIAINRKKYGDKPCDHNAEFGKEYVFGGDTGDLVCTKCWQVFSRSELDQMFSKEKKSD